MAKPFLPAPKPTKRERKPFDARAWRERGARKYAKTRKHGTDLMGIAAATALRFRERYGK